MDLIMLGMAEALQKLVNNPDLSKTISEAYALSEAEKAKAAEAQEIIATADKITAEIKAREDVLLVVNDRIAEAKKIEAFNEDTLKAISERTKELDKREAKTIAAAAENETKEKSLEAKAEKIAEREESVKRAEQQITAAREDLKKRSEVIAKAAAI